MAFSQRNLCVLAYTNGFTTWHYKGPCEHLDEITAPAYFIPCADMLHTRDVIVVDAAGGVTMVLVETSDLTSVVVRRML